MQKPEYPPEGTIIRRWFEVRIVERREVVCMEKDWKQVRDEAKLGLGKYDYDYVYSVGSKIEEVTRFEQRVEDIDIKLVICAINELQMPMNRIPYQEFPVDPERKHGL